MQQISIFLDKYKRFGFKDQIIKETLISLLKEKFGVDLKREDIKIKDGNLDINVSGPLKSEIFLNKDLIKEDLNNLLEGNNKAHNIR